MIRSVAYPIGFRTLTCQRTVRPLFRMCTRFYSNKDQKYSDIEEFNKRKTEYNFHQNFDQKHLDLDQDSSPEHKSVQHSNRTDQLHSQISQRYHDEDLMNINQLLENDPRLNQFEPGSPEYKELLYKISEEFKLHQAKQAKRQENWERWKAVAIGVFVIVGVVSAHQLFTRYNWYMSWLNKSSYDVDDEKIKDKRPNNIKQLEHLKAKLLGMLNPEFTNGLLNSDCHTGLYIFGNQNNRKLPTRIDFFNNMILKQVKISDDYLVVITDDGKLYHYTKSMKEPELIKVPSKIEKCQIFKDKLYLLTKLGEVGYVPRPSTSTNSLVTSRNWLGLTTKKGNYTPLSLNLLGRGERISDFSGGDNHLLMLSSKGRLFNMKTCEGKNRGQFGVPNYSPFEERNVPVGAIFEMTLLNNEVITVNENKKVLKPRVFTHISSGKYHCIASDQDNNIWAWGDNGFGQCGISVNYKTNIQSTPQKVLTKDQLRKLGESNKDVSIESLLCNDETSLIKLNSGIISFGNGLKGQLGTNRFLHVSNNPGRIKAFDNLNEFNENTNQVEAIGIKDISSGSNHTCIKLNNAGEGKNVLVFGDNEFGQYGNGKLVKSAKPIYIPKLIEPEDLKDINSDNKVLNELTRKFNNPDNRMQLKEKMKINGVNVQQVMEATDNSSVIYYKRV